MQEDRKSLKLEVVSQEKALLSQEVNSVTLTTATGEITILPGHVPLFSQVRTGVLTFRADGEEYSMVVSDGFVNITPDDKVIVMVDSGVLARDISAQKAEDAIRAAHETMEKTQDQRELMMAEASLRQAMLELKVAQKTRKVQI